MAAAEAAAAATAVAAATAATMAAVTASMGKMGGAVGSVVGGGGGGGGYGGGKRGGTSIQDSLARQITRENGQNVSLGIPPFTNPPLDDYKDCFAKKTHYFCLSIPRTMFVAAARSFGDFDVRGDHKELPQKFEIALSLLGFMIERLAHETYLRTERAPQGGGEDVEVTALRARVRVFMEPVHAKPSAEKKDWCVEGSKDSEEGEDPDRVARRRARQLGKSEKQKREEAPNGVSSTVTDILDKFLEESVKRTLQGSNTETTHKYDPDKIVLIRLHVLVRDNAMKDTLTGVSDLLTKAVPEFASRTSAFVPPPPPPPPGAADEQPPAGEGGGGEGGGGEGGGGEKDKDKKEGGGGGDDAKAPAKATKPRRTPRASAAAAGGVHFPYHRVIGSREDIIRALGPVVMLAPRKGKQDLEQYIRWVFSPAIACAMEHENVCEAQADVNQYEVRGEFPIPHLVAEITDISCFYPKRLATMQWWHLCVGLPPNSSEKQQYASLIKSGSDIVVPYLVDLRDRERREICRRVKWYRNHRPDDLLEFCIASDFDAHKPIWNTPSSIFAHMTQNHRGVGRPRPPPPPSPPPPSRPNAPVSAEEEEEAMRAEAEGFAADGLPEDTGAPKAAAAAKEKARVDDGVPENLRYVWPDGTDVEEEDDLSWAISTFFKMFRATDDEKKQMSAADKQLTRIRFDDFKRFHHERYIREAGARVYGSSEATFDSLKKINAEKLRHDAERVKVFAAKELPAKIQQAGIRKEVSPEVECYYVNRFRAHVMNSFREKALRVFFDILYRDGKLSPASRAVVDWGLQYLNDPKNIYKNFSRPHSHVLPPTEKNEGMSVFASFIVNKMREFEHVLEVCKTHSTCLLAWLSCLHVHADSKFHPNLLLDGEYSSGKSFVMLLMLRLLIPGVVKDIAWMTGKALAVEGDFNDEVHLHQEVHPAMLGIGKSRDSLDPQTSSVKNAMTSGIQEVKSLVIDPYTGKRTQVITKSQCSTVYIVALNLKEGFKLHEIPPAVRSRYAMFFIERMGKEALDLLIRSGCFQGPLYEATITNSHRIHFLVWLILKLEWTGVFPPINLEVANHFLHKTLSLAAKNDVVAASEKRNSERLLFLCKVCTVLNAITKYFDMPGSPISKKPWQPRDILGVGPLLVCDTEIVAFVQKLNAFQFEHPHQHTVIEALRKSRFPGKELSEYFKKDAADVDDGSGKDTKHSGSGGGGAYGRMVEDEEAVMIAEALAVEKERETSQAGGSSDQQKKQSKQKTLDRMFLSKEARDREEEEERISKKRKELYVYSDLIPTQSRGKKAHSRPSAYHTGDREDRAPYQPGEPNMRNKWASDRDHIKSLTVVLAQAIPVSTKEISDVLYKLHNELVPIELGKLDGMAVWTPVRGLDFENGQLKCAARMFEMACLESRLDSAIRAVLEHQFRTPRRLLSGKLMKGTYHIFLAEEYAGTTGVIQRTNAKYMVPALNTALSLSLPGAEDLPPNNEHTFQSIMIKSDIDDYEARKHLEMTGWCDPDILIGSIGPGISVIPTEYLTNINLFTKADLTERGKDPGDYPDIDKQQLDARRKFAEENEARQLKLAEATIEARRIHYRSSSSPSSSSSSSLLPRKTPMVRRDSDISSTEFKAKRRKEQEEMATGRVSAQKRRRLENVLMMRPESGTGEHAFVYAAPSSSSSSSSSSSYRQRTGVQEEEIGLF